MTAPKTNLLHRKLRGCSSSRYLAHAASRMSASFVEALGTLASPRTAAAHSSRSLVTLSSQLLDESVSSEATLPSVEAGQSRVSTSVRLGSSRLCFRCPQLLSPLRLGRGGLAPASANQPCEASTHASTSAREGQPRRWSGERARIGGEGGSRGEARRRLTLEDVELRTLGSVSREMGLRGGDALG